MVEKFARTFEELGGLADLKIPEKPSPELQKKLRAVANFFKRNNYENAKIIMFGVAVMLGKSAVDIIEVVDRSELDFEDLKYLIRVCVENPDLFTENLFAGAGSAVTQKFVEETRKAPEGDWAGAKDGLKKIINISRKTVANETTNT